MKNFFIVTMIALQSFSALAVTSILDPSYIRQLPSVHVLNVAVDMGPHLAAVQPTAHVNFEFTSCGHQRFEANVEEKDGVLFVALDFERPGMDCRGPQITRTYNIQISSDYRQPVVILNPPDHVYTR